MVGITLVVSSCGDGAVEPTTPPPPPTPVATTVTINPDSAALTSLGETARFTVEVRDQNGHVLSGATVAWVSSDASVAAVDASGLVTAVSNGTAAITATAGSASGRATVTVRQMASTVLVTPLADTLTALGDTLRLSAEALDENGQTVAGAEVAWSSDDTLVATVDAAGLATAVSSGMATITATVGSASGAAQIVVEQTAATVRVSPDSLELPVGYTARLSATALDPLGSDVPDAAIEWRSSDATIATVDSLGRVRAEAIGAATITASLGALADSSRISVLSDDPSDHHAALTVGLPERPFVNTTVGGNQGLTQTVGTLRLRLNPDAFPVIVGQGDRPTVLVAGSRLGEGRVVALPGQDFLSPGDRATLLDNVNAVRLLANAVRWTGGRRTPLRVLVDNRRIANALEDQGFDEVKVVDRRGPYVRDWTDNALANVDVAVVLANDWNTPRLAEASVGPLRTFAERGGGLVVAASALHWSWWIERDHGPLTAEALLRDTGITWNKDSIEDIAPATTSFDARLLPPVVWAAYIGRESLDAAQTALLPDLFNDALELGRTDELDLALARLLRDTPPLPVSADAPEARLSAEVANSLGAYEWPAVHPWAAAFPGLPDPAARRVSGSVVVDATGGEFPANASRRERHVPLEFYAPPGGLVTISIPSSHATGELRVAVGWEHSDLRPLRDWHPEWRRPPALRRIFAVDAAETAVTNAYGGSISLVVPASYRGTIPVTVEGAIPMAVYTADESNAAEWFADLDAGAPQGIIQKPGGIRFVISAESARGITDPGEVSAWWDGFQQHHAELSGEPAPRAYESTWIFDPQVGSGAANAGPADIRFPLDVEAWVLVPGTAEGRAWLATLPAEGPRRPHSPVPPPGTYSPAVHGVDWWLFGHELGHQWQTEDWGSAWAGRLYSEIGEVAVNLFTTYTLNGYVFGGGDSEMIGDLYRPNSVDHAALSQLRWPTANNSQRFDLYRQLIFEFGWDAMKQVFHSYYDPAYPPSIFGGELDGFAIRLSAIVERDLVAFFRHWEYPLSESAAATIHGFGHEEWLPPGW